MRFGFVTCVQLGLSCMEEIRRIGGHLDLIVTLRDDQAISKSGRVWLDEFSRKDGSRLLKVRHVNDQAVIDAVREERIDWLFIIGWSQIAGSAVLSAATQGVLGMHPTLLPQGRGRAAIPWAILKGLEETGVTLFKLDCGVDTGPIVAQERLPLAPDETASTLYNRVNEAHIRLTRTVWPSLVEGRVTMTPQDEERATVWPARTPADGRIRSEMSVDEVDRLVRATTTPYPGAFYERGGTVMRIWAGAPALDGKVVRGVVVPCSDGQYLATEYDWECGPS